MKSVFTTAVLTGLVIGAFGAGRVMAGTPFGGDDTGTIPSDAPKGPVTKCENNVGKAVAKLAGSIIKCHCTEASKPGQSDATEEPCEAKALAKFAKTKTVGCPACINLSSLATTVEGLVDSNNNQVWCDSTGTPFGGDDTGFKPDVTTTAGKAEAKCLCGVGKGVANIITAYGKCTASEALGKPPGDAAEDQCEAAAVTKFTTKTKTANCPACTNLASIATFVDGVLDGSNSLVYCGSPSGAFLE